MEMNEEKFNEFARHSQGRRKQWFMESLDCEESEAQVLAKKDFERIINMGFATKNNFTFNLIDENGTDVGYLWYVLRNEGSNQKLFICDILVREGYRGKGYGREALNLVEINAKDMSLNKIGLHVIANNSVAVGLYKSSGYKVKSFLMDKELSE